MYRRQIGCLIGMVILIVWVSVTLAETVSEEARRFMARGMAAVEMAKTPKDYERAVREFEQAAKLAPNWPDVYFNLGSVQAKAGNYGEAMRYYKRYLELAPNAPDAAKVREESYKLEYRAEQQMVKEKLRKERGRFSLEDGVIYDSQLGLEWAPSNGQVLNHYQAEGYARALSLAGGGWRLPTRAELKSLYDKSKPGNVDPVFGVGDKWVWTSELYNEVPSMPGAVGFYFYDGGEKAGDRDNINRHNNRRALAVRSSQSILDSEKASVLSLLTGAYKGVRNYENGDKYEGEFTNRKFNGKGTYTYANGDKYVGEFVDGKFTSKGTFTCSNGKQFTGNLENKVPLEFTTRCN
ncbi:MAG: tetratricopeptide repeat protein [Thermodesulfobacteriota bacterium]|nr:tetratricopeptide repeat protein [Thermodesulfobacteriota bacterium]